MRLKLTDKIEFLNSLDKDHKSNLYFIRKGSLQEKLNKDFTNSNIKKVIFLSSFTFLMTFYTVLMDYISNYSSFSQLALSAYRIIDPVYCIFSLFVYILSRFAKAHNNITFTTTIVNIYVFGSVLNYSVVSSIEQFDFHHHPSYSFCILLLSILFTFKPLKILLYSLLGVIIILTFYRLFNFEDLPEQVSWSVVVFTIPISFLTAKIHYNNIIKIFVDKIKLEGANKRLEKKIIIRTRELEETNEELKNQLELQEITKQNLEKAKEKAEKSDKLKTAFLSNLSHEIRTPLNSIIGFSSLLNNPKTDPEKTRRYTTLINSCGKELVFIIDQLVEVSKIESGEIEVNKLYFMVNDLLFDMQEKTIDRLREMKKDHISFSINNTCYESNIRLYNDLVKIKQILLNLIENSIKFTEKGRIEIGFTMPNKEIFIFHVQDTGIGISEKDKEFLFEQFSQGNTGISRKYGGLGLGLSISKTFIELLGGKLWFESEEGKGSIFYFSLPI